MAISKSRYKFNHAKLAALEIISLIRSRIIDCGDTSFFSMEEWEKAEQELTRIIEK